MKNKMSIFEKDWRKELTILRVMGYVLLFFSLSFLSFASPSDARISQSTLLSKSTNLVVPNELFNAESLAQSINAEARIFGLGGELVKEDTQLDENLTAHSFEQEASAEEGVSTNKDDGKKFNTLSLAGEEESSFGVREDGNAENISMTVSPGKKSSTWSEVTKGVLYVIGGLLAFGALLYILWTIYACCKGTRTLAESGHTLGWWPFGYFAHGQQAGYSGIAAEPSRIPAGPATPQP